jgi:hypothetical protein
VTIRSALVFLAFPILGLGLVSCAAVTGTGSAGPATGPVTGPVTGPATGPVTGSGTGSAAQAGAADSASGHGLKKIHDPGLVTGTLHGHCSYRDNGQLPDPRCTPGSIDPAVTQADIGSTICRKGYTKTVRPPEAQTERFKFDVAYPAYGTPQSEQTELDHLVSLELGGSNDAANLWPESPPTPNPKDDVENALNKAVCDGQVTLAAAQNAIASDWLTAEAKLGLTGAGSTGTGSVGGGSTGSTSGGGGSGARCTARASYDAKYGDYDIYVHSNQPGQTVTAKASNGASHSYRTDSSGYAVVYLKAARGDTIQVTVGPASCSTRA